MKVLNTFIDSRLGGPQMRGLTVAQKLREYGIETEFLAPPDIDNFPAKARSEGFTVHTEGAPAIAPMQQVVDNVRYGATGIRSIPKLKNLIQRRNINVVHANVSVNFHSAIAASRSPASLVWHFNDTLIPWPITRITAGLAKRLADTIAVASGSVADHYFRGPEQKVTTLYAPVDTDEFDPATVSMSLEQAAIEIDTDSTIVGTVGNLNPIKGQNYLLEAMPKVASEINSPLTVLIAGAKLDSRSEYYRRLQKLASESGKNVDVKFLGHRSDIPELLSLFDVFVLPSIAEACPIVVLEAMAMKRPVVATKVGGVPEQIDDKQQGWLVPPKNPDRMADAIIDALSDPEEAKRRGHEARDKVLTTFSLRRCVERHAQIYRNSLKCQQM